jgi:hypothetical protein
MDQLGSMDQAIQSLNISELEKTFLSRYKSVEEMQSTMDKHDEEVRMILTACRESLTELAKAAGKPVEEETKDLLPTVMDVKEVETLLNSVKGTEHDPSYLIDCIKRVEAMNETWDAERHGVASRLIEQLESQEATNMMKSLGSRFKGEPSKMMVAKDGVERPVSQVIGNYTWHYKLSSDGAHMMGSPDAGEGDHWMILKYDPSVMSVQLKKKLDKMTLEEQSFITALRTRKGDAMQPRDIDTLLGEDTHPRIDSFLLFNPAYDSAWE